MVEEEEIAGTGLIFPARACGQQFISAALAGIGDLSNAHERLIRHSKRRVQEEVRFEICRVLARGHRQGRVSRPMRWCGFAIEFHPAAVRTFFADRRKWRRGGARGLFELHHHQLSVRRQRLTAVLGRR